ncbi:Heat shock [Cordyceps militaris]|uniref:Heat shock n=1 Tax=Cordyceps militaris TaxID=73501 RepID=A0A2H4SKC9_CORMI|nr:Heat shock [Cordyceps militaris]
MHFSQAVRKSHRLFAPHHRGGHNSKRRYASSGQPSPDTPSRIVWPVDARPTPYQVLNMATTGQPYDKSSFNRLVKVYHPDMRHHHHHYHTELDAQTLLHRYHLVVAAHELLSNPAQRRRYDLYKLGWMGGPVGAEDRRRPRADWSRRRPRPDDTDPPAPSPMRQTPIYMSNHAFAILALALAFGYAVVSCERVRRAAWREQTQRMQLVDGDVVRALYGAQHLVSGRSKDERILAFLCRRHGAERRCREQAEGGFVPLYEDWEQNICRH